MYYDHDHSQQLLLWQADFVFMLLQAVTHASWVLYVHFGHLVGFVWQDHDVPPDLIHVFPLFVYHVSHDQLQLLLVALLV